MKKRSLLLLLPLVLAAIAGCVNWKLDHPALTAADAAFARLIRGADEVEIATFGQRSKVSLRGTKLLELVDGLHFENQRGLGSQGYDALYTFTWKKKGTILSTFDIDFDAGFPLAPSLMQTDVETNPFGHPLNPRSASHLAAKVGALNLDPSG